jgi:hypothetical protein
MRVPVSCDVVVVGDPIEANFVKKRRGGIGLVVPLSR